MVELYGILYELINPICPCYVDHYPTDQEGITTKVYPYCEITFPNIVANNSFSDNNLFQIDIWDNKDTDIREIENITDSIHKVLNRYHFINNHMQFSINRNDPYRLSLADVDLTIQRRELRYLITIYEI